MPHYDTGVVFPPLTPDIPSITGDSVNVGALGARCSVHWSTNCTQAPTVNAGSGHTHVAQGLFAVIIAMAKIGPRPLVSCCRLSNRYRLAVSGPGCVA